MPRLNGVRWRGQPQATRRLNKAVRTVSNDGATAAVIAGGLVFINEAKTLAPVRTGTLRRSLHVGGARNKTPEFTPTPDTPELPAPSKNLRGILFAKIGTNLNYAQFNEFGTSRMPARPFMRPALDNKRGEALDEIQDTLNFFLNKALP